MHQTLHSKEKIALGVVFGERVLTLGAKNEVPHLDNVLVIRVFPRSKCAGHVVCNWEKVARETIEGARGEVTVLGSIAAIIVVARLSLAISSMPCRSSVDLFDSGNRLWQGLEN